MEKYFEGIGRRKASTCRVRIVKKEGEISIIVNDKKLNKDDYGYDVMMQPFSILGILDGYSVTVKVSGGGVTGRVDSIKLGIARALLKEDETRKPALKVANLLTRDPREVERKKYYLKKARKKPQFSKR